MNEKRVVPLRQPDEIDDPLTEILRCGAKRLVQQAVEAEFAAFLRQACRSRTATGASALSGTDMIPHARSRRGSGLSRCRSRRRAIVGRRGQTSASAIRRQSYRNGLGGRRASTFFCRLFICAAFPLATFRTS